MSCTFLIIYEQLNNYNKLSLWFCSFNCSTWRCICTHIGCEWIAVSRYPLVRTTTG